MLSAIYLLAYVSLGAVSLLLGAVATAHGLAFAVNLGAGVIALFSVITVALVAMTRAPVRQRKQVINAGRQDLAK